MFGLNAIMLPRFQSEEDKACYRDAIRDIFPLSSTPSSSRYDTDLANAIREEMKSDGEAKILLLSLYVVGHRLPH